jgi:hypothetical protein
MRRSRKPVWAFPSIGGSNPPLSVPAPRSCLASGQGALAVSKDLVLARSATQRDDRMIAILLLGLLLALASRVDPERIPGRPLLARCYAAIGGSPASD